MKDTKAWFNEIQKNESFAQKYRGLDVKSIQEKAKEDGYEINNGDLEKTAGGRVLVNVGNQKASINVSAKGEGATAINNADINFNMDFGNTDK